MNPSPIQEQFRQRAFMRLGPVTEGMYPKTVEETWDMYDPTSVYNITRSQGATATMNNTINGSAFSWRTSSTSARRINGTGHAIMTNMRTSPFYAAWIMRFSANQTSGVYSTFGVLGLAGTKSVQIGNYMRGAVNDGGGNDAPGSLANFHVKTGPFTYTELKSGKTMAPIPYDTAWHLFECWSLGESGVWLFALDDARGAFKQPIAVTVDQEAGYAYYSADNNATSADIGFDSYYSYFYADSGIVGFSFGG